MPSMHSRSRVACPSLLHRALRCVVKLLGAKSSLLIGKAHAASQPNPIQWNRVTELRTFAVLILI